MPWITSRRLRTEYGLSWLAAEQILQQQSRLFRQHRDWRGWLIGSLHLSCFFWLVSGARLAFPMAPHGRLALLELPALMGLSLALLVLPRLLFAGEILAAARARADSGPA
jgi:hypothetical protein